MISVRPDLESGLAPDLTKTFLSFFFFAPTSTQYLLESSDTPAASLDMVIVAAFFLGSSLCLSTWAFLVDSSTWACRSRISASFSASSATTSSAAAPAAGVGAGGDGGFASFPGASFATPSLPLLAGGMLPLSAARAGVLRVGAWVQVSLT